MLLVVLLSILLSAVLAYGEETEKLDEVLFQGIRYNSRTGYLHLHACGITMDGKIAHREKQLKPRWYYVDIEHPFWEEYEGRYVRKYCRVIYKDNQGEKYILGEVLWIEYDYPRPSLFYVTLDIPWKYRLDTDPQGFKLDFKKEELTPCPDYTSGMTKIKEKRRHGEQLRYLAIHGDDRARKILEENANLNR